MKSRPHRLRIAAALVAAGLLAAVAFTVIYVQSRQGLLADRFRQHLTTRLSKAFDLDVRIGSVAGDPRGTIALRDVRVLVARGDGEPPLDVFTCGEIRFRYTLLDFFRENFTSWFDVVLERPVFYANVPFSAQKPEARSFELFSGFAQRVRSNARLIIRDGGIAWIGKEGTLSGIDGVVSHNAFDLSVTLNHMRLGSFDTTTTLNIDGRLAGDRKTGDVLLSGSAVTRGTVINWKPVPKEANVRFELSKDTLRLWDTDVLGGVKIAGTIGHTSRQEIDIEISARDYPLKEMHDIFSFSGGQSIGGRMSGRLKLQGALTEPRMAGELLIEDNRAPGARFRAMQLFFEGIFPQMKISRSQMILTNGNPMQFASDQEIHVKEMFSSDMYERLITRSQQRTVTWKNWTLYREGDGDRVLLEHPLSAPVVPDDADGSGEDAEYTDTPPSLETLLGGQESVKMELKDDEQMFTLQKKAQF